MEGLEEINWLWVAIKIIAVIFLVGLNGFFVAAEFALEGTRNPTPTALGQGTSPSKSRQTCRQ